MIMLGVAKLSVMLSVVANFNDILALLVIERAAKLT